MAQQLGMSRPPTVSEWENDKAQPNALEIQKILRILGVDANWLLLGQGRMEPGEESDAELKLEAIQMIMNGPLTARELETIRQNLEDEQLNEDIHRRTDRLPPESGRSAAGDASA